MWQPLARPGEIGASSNWLSSLPAAVAPGTGQRDGGSEENPRRLGGKLNDRGACAEPWNYRRWP
jgi:hypothetical protein